MLKSLQIAGFSGRNGHFHAFVTQSDRPKRYEYRPRAYSRPHRDQRRAADLEIDDGPDRGPDCFGRRPRPLLGPRPQRRLLPVADERPVHRGARFRHPRSLLDGLAGRDLAESAVALRADLLPGLLRTRPDWAHRPLRVPDHDAAGAAALALPPEGVADAGRGLCLLLPRGASRDPSAGRRLHRPDLLAAGRAAAPPLARARRDDRRAAPGLVGATGDPGAVRTLGEPARWIHRRLPAPGLGDGRARDRPLARDPGLGPAEHGSRCSAAWVFSRR